MFQKKEKENPAVTTDGHRTIWGSFQAEDAAQLAAQYDKVPERVISDIAEQIGDPRLLEVSGVVEIVQRYLEGSFTRLRDLTVKIAASPLSILFFNQDKGSVQRIVTKETELLHKPVEKLFLRAKSILGINQLLNQQFGLQVTTGCSCCLIAVETKNLQALYESNYYQDRERFGRRFDSDVLTVSGNLLQADSVTDVPASILNATADFHEEEVASYLRFWKVNNEVVKKNPVGSELQGQMIEVSQFLLGQKTVARAV